jgi:hypothetical protein
VRSSWQRHFVATLDTALDTAPDTAPGPVADPRTGEVVPGLAARPAPEPRSFSLRPLPGGTEQITRAWRDGELDLRGLISLDGGAP